MIRINKAALAATLTAVALVSACSSEKPAERPQVASINSAPSSTPATAAATAQPQGVQLRLDTTEKESARLWDVYQDCLYANGVKELPKDSGPSVRMGSGKRALDLKSGEPKSAYAACKAKEPLEPVELDPDRNPNFAAQWQDNVRCLRKNGLMVHVTEPGSWTYDSSHGDLPENQEELEKQCIQETFGAKK